MRRTGVLLSEHLLDQIVIGDEDTLDWTELLAVDRTVLLVQFVAVFVQVGNAAVQGESEDGGQGGEGGGRLRNS